MRQVLNVSTWTSAAASLTRRALTTPWTASTPPAVTSASVVRAINSMLTTTVKVRHCSRDQSAGVRHCSRDQSAGIKVKYCSRDQSAGIKVKYSSRDQSAGIKVKHSSLEHTAAL